MSECIGSEHAVCSSQSWQSLNGFISMFFLEYNLQDSYQISCSLIIGQIESCVFC